MTRLTSRHMAQFGLVIAMIFTSFSLTLDPASSAEADGKVMFIRNLVELDFPDSMTFSLIAKADDQIESVALEYGTNATSCVRSVARQSVDIEPGQEIEAEWVWDFKDSGSLPMGSQVWWEWEATLANGEVARSLHQDQVVIDQRYSWKQTGADPADITSVDLWYHDTSESFARDLAAIGQKALQETQTDFGVAPARQVQIILYNNADEVYESGLFFSEWTGGYAMSDYSLVVIGVEDGDYEWGEEVINHELAHLISGELTANCLAVSMPTWLSEGFSMYAEGGVATSEQDKVKKALTDGVLPPLHTLAAGFAANDASARLSYAQSGMVVEFMVQEYGADKLPQLFAAIQAGTLAEDSLRQVYSLDVDTLDNAWRSSLDFAAQDMPPTPTATPLPTAAPTLPLFAPFDATATPLPTAAPTLVAQIVTSPTPAVTSSQAPTPASAGGPAIPCLGSSAAFLGLFLVLISLVYRRK